MHSLTSGLGRIALILLAQGCGALVPVKGGAVSSPRPHAEPSRQPQTAETAKHSNAPEASETHPLVDLSDQTRESPQNSITTDRAAPIESTPLALTTEPASEEGVRVRDKGEVAAAVADEQLQVWNFGGTENTQHVSNRNAFHPGTRVVVDAHPRLFRRTRASQQQLTATARLLASLRNRGYWPIRLCFENVTRDHPDPGGKIHLRLSASSSGKIQSVRFIRSTFHDRAVGNCITSQLRKLRLDRPLGRPLDADVTVSTWPGDLPLLPLPRESSRRNNQDFLAIDAWVSGHLDAIRPCFADAREQDRSLWGRLALSFRLDQSGKPIDLRQSSTHFNAPKTVECVASHLESMRVPDADTRLRYLVAFRLERPTLPSPSTSSGTDSMPSPNEDASPAPAIPSMPEAPSSQEQ